MSEHNNPQGASSPDNPKRYKSHCIAVTFGLGGHTEIYYSDDPLYGGGTGHLFGYDRPETWRPHEGFEYVNSVVIDGRKMFTEHPELAFKLPMIDHVPDGQPERFRDKCPDLAGSIMVRTIAGQPNLWGALATETLVNPEFSGLDFVSPRDYAAIVQPLGAAVGRISDGHIVWDPMSGEVTP